MIKKIFTTIFFITMLSFIFEFFGQAPHVFADNNLESIVGEQLENLNLNDLENIFKSVNNISFKELINKLLNGNFNFDSVSILNYILQLTKNSIKNLLAPFILIFTICVLGYILKNTSSEKTSNGIGNIVHLGLISVISIIVITLVMNSVINTKNIFFTLKNIMEVSFPILLTLMATSGASASVSIYKPIMALMSGSIIELFINFLLPIFIVVMVLVVADNLTDNIKLSNLTNLLSKVYKWTVGIIFGLFTTILAMFGVTAGSYDTISFKTAQYSVKNYIPFVGGYLSGGFSIIACASVLIKNSIGLACFILILIMILKPIITILIIKLFLGLLSATLQNIADKKIITFCLGTSKALNMLIAVIASVCAMFLIFIGLCITTGNLI